MSDNDDNDGIEAILLENSETLVKVSVSTTFVQSRSVSVSTTPKFSSLDESRSRQLENFQVSTGLGLDNFGKVESRKVSVSTTSL